MWQALSVVGVINGVLLSLAFQNRQIRINLQASIPVASVSLIVISFLLTLTLLIYIDKSNFFRIRALRYLELLEERFIKEKLTEYSVYPKKTKDIFEKEVDKILKDMPKSCLYKTSATWFLRCSVRILLVIEIVSLVVIWLSQ